jgi:uncharacterized protein (UPF0248 family)
MNDLKRQYLISDGKLKDVFEEFKEAFEKIIYKYMFTNGKKEITVIGRVGGTNCVEITFEDGFTYNLQWYFNEYLQNLEKTWRYCREKMDEHVKKLREENDC